VIRFKSPGSTTLSSFSDLNRANIRAVHSGVVFFIRKTPKMFSNEIMPCFQQARSGATEPVQFFVCLCYINTITLTYLMSGDEIMVDDGKAESESKSELESEGFLQLHLS